MSNEEINKNLESLRQDLLEAYGHIEDLIRHGCHVDRFRYAQSQIARIVNLIDQILEGEPNENPETT